MPPYQLATGWDGYYAWEKQAQDASRVRAAQVDPEINAHFHFLEGFELGYPRSAR
jgi:hypothetical protein